MGGWLPCFLHSDPGSSRHKDSAYVYSEMMLVGSKIHTGRQGSHECGGTSSLYKQQVSIMRLRVQGLSHLDLACPLPQSVLKSHAHLLGAAHKSS